VRYALEVDAEAIEQLVEAYVSLYRTGDLAAIEHVIAEDYTDRSLPHFSGRAGVALAVRALHAGFADLTCTVDHVVAAGDRAAFFFTVEGTHVGRFGGYAPTGARIRWTGADFIRVGADGRIVELWTVQDASLARGLAGGAAPGH
jgi:predicted ester cyclase